MDVPLEYAEGNKFPCLFIFLNPCRKADSGNLVIVGTGITVRRKTTLGMRRMKKSKDRLELKDFLLLLLEVWLVKTWLDWSSEYWWFLTQYLLLILPFFTWNPRIQGSLLNSINVPGPRCFLCCSPATHHNQHLPARSPGCCWAGWKSSLWLIQENHVAETQRSLT